MQTRSAQSYGREGSNEVECAYLVFRGKVAVSRARALESGDSEAESGGHSVTEWI